MSRVGSWQIAKLLFLLSITSTPFFAHSKSISSKLGFSEKKFRHLWDMKCADWPETFGKEKRSDNPAFIFERKDLSYRLLGRARFSPELGESLAGTHQTLEKILLDYPNYPSWILKKVNDHPEKGQSFFVHLNGLEYSKFASAHHVLLTGPFSFDIAGLSLKSRTTIEILSEKAKLPDCKLSKGKKVSAYVWNFRMIPRKDILEWLIGELYLLEVDGQVQIQARVRLKPSRLLYEVIPTKVIENELKYRGRQLLNNLIEIRRQMVWKNDSVAPSGL